ncbi:SDR family NAD(P)-dependent oxidoreductase [Egicoccus halophilus]|uniref:Short-chain dehydrogenase n=1 Tax=Egicoccus halophilus TaxID=1670830 RepID=A0A8J3A4M3_9ACTN|nr:SDR family oxidoreductase [Egicoccus halophilus]GGI02439.1 short-chain dehydrogenase [Egicoccus halophilus]
MSRTDDALEIDWHRVVLPGLGAESTVLVAGAGGAIGRRVAFALGALGGNVVLMGRTEPGLEETADLIAAPDRVAIVAGDIAAEADGRRAVEAAVARFGGLTGVVNAAAVSDAGLPFGSIDRAAIDQVMGPNLFGAIFLSQAAFPALRESGGGSIVHVGSVEAYRAQPGKLLYGTSKAALLRVASQLAIEGGPDGIRVNCVSAGQTPTPLIAHDATPGSPRLRPASNAASLGAESIPIGRRGVLDDYVGVTFFLLSDLAAYVTGKDVPAEGGVLNRRLR